MKIAGI